MNHLIHEFLQQVCTADEKTSSNAITHLSYILEMNSWKLSYDERIDRFGGVIAQELIKLQIDQSDEVEIIEALTSRIVPGNKLASALLFAIGQGSASVALRPLIKVIERQLANFSENEFYQALTSLERLLFFNEALSFEQKKEVISKTGLLTATARKLLTSEPLTHSDLESLALRLISRVILLLNDELVPHSV